MGGCCAIPPASHSGRTIVHIVLQMSAVDVRQSRSVRKFIDDVEKQLEREPFLPSHDGRIQKSVRMDNFEYITAREHAQLEVGASYVLDSLRIYA